MWGQKKSLPIITELARALPGWRELLAEAKAQRESALASLPPEANDVTRDVVGKSYDVRIDRYAEKVAEIEKEIAGRTANKAWWTDVAHIGTEKDPHRDEEFAGREAALENAARLRVRKELVAAFGVEFPREEFERMVDADPELIKKRNDLAREYLCEGLAGGAEEYSRLYKLGGGPLLKQAIVEVRNWQRVGIEVGEG